MRVPQLRDELRIRRRDLTGTKESLRRRLEESLDAELQCEVELRPGEWHRADIQSIAEEDVTLRVKRRRGVMTFNKYSPKLRQHLIAPLGSPKFADMHRLEDSEKAEIAYRLHRDALWRQENHGGTAEEARHQSGLKLGLPPESLPLSRSRGTGGRVLAIRPRVDIHSEALADMDDSTDEDEPIFLDRPAAKTLGSIRKVSLHRTSIGYSDDQRADKNEMQALQELRERNSVIAKRKARSFRGRDSRPVNRQQRDDSSNSMSPTAAYAQEIPDDSEISAMSKFEASDEGSTCSGPMEAETHDTDKQEGIVPVRSVEPALAQHASKSTDDHMEATTNSCALKRELKELEEPTQEQAQPSNAEATRLEHEQAVAEKAQQ
eukprot:COSAG02_NODE_3943_length_6003_cov_73.069783_5_plen_376_part_01